MVQKKIAMRSVYGPRCSGGLYRLRVFPIPRALSDLVSRVKGMFIIAICHPVVLVMVFSAPFIHPIDLTGHDSSLYYKKIAAWRVASSPNKTGNGSVCQAVLAHLVHSNDVMQHSRFLFFILRL